MGHDHKPHFSRTLAWVVILNFLFVLVEVFFGLVSHSLALLSDGGHNLGDVLGLSLAWGAAWLAGLPATYNRTYGYKRATLLAPLFSSLILLVAMGSIAWEALQRLAHPAAVHSGTVMLVAGIGVVINSAAALLLHKQAHDVNMKSAFLHMAADAGISLGVVISGLAVALSGWVWLDPLVSLLIVAIILAGIYKLIKDTLDLNLDAVPAGVDIQKVRTFLLKQPGVTGMHDLHVWALSAAQRALTVHLVMPRNPGDRFLVQLEEELHARFGLDHATIQIEQSDLGHQGCAPGVDACRP